MKRKHKQRKPKKKMGICQYCGSEISIWNKFYDVYTCKECANYRG